MNPFESYADDKGYSALPKKFAKIAQGPSALDERMEEKQRLSRAYLAWKRAHAKAMLAQEPRLKNFRRYLKTVDHTGGEELLDAIQSSWIPAAPVDVRLFALRLVDARCQRIRLLMGEDPLDDPWPPESNVYLDARSMLYAGGRG